MLQVQMLPAMIVMKDTIFKVMHGSISKCRRFKDSHSQVRLCLTRISETENYGKHPGHCMTLQVLMVAETPSLMKASYRTRMQTCSNGQTKEEIYFSTW